MAHAPTDPIATREVAVVIPTYNRREWVVEAVESVLAGSVIPTIVVVDDGSNDGTAKDLAGRFGERIQVVVQKNRERGAARNHGVSKVDAELILFLDADDLFGPEHVSSLMALAAAHPQIGLFHTPFVEADANGKPTGGSGGVPGPHHRSDFLMGMIQIPPSVMAIRRSLFDSVGGFDERRELSGSEDWLLVANALRLGDSMCGSESTVKMRKHDGNSMGDAESMEASMLLAHRLHFEQGRGAGESAAEVELKERSRAALMVNAATTWFAAGQAIEARRCLREAIRAWPGSLRDRRVSVTFVKSLLGPVRVEQLKGWMGR